MNANVREFAEQLMQVYSDIADLRISAKAILEAAKEQGINTKALSKVAKEMLQDSDKLRQKIEDEQQLDLFREKSGLLKMKGLVAMEPAE